MEVTASLSSGAEEFAIEVFASAFHRDPALGARDVKLLPETLCRIERRQVMHDFTVSFQSAWHQILPTPGLAIRPKDEVLVRQYTDGTLSFTIRNKRVATKPIAKMPYIRHVKRLIPTLTAA